MTSIRQSKGIHQSKGMDRYRRHRWKIRRSAGISMAAKTATAAAIFGLVALVIAPETASGDNCLDRTKRLAAEYGLSTDPPTIPPGEARKPLTPDDLARSGGVVEPPAVSDRSVITPPDMPSGMPTMPDLKPAPPPSGPTSGGPKGAGTLKGSLDPQDATSLQAILVAARAQAERGMENECLSGLRRAQELLDRQKKKAG